jgi:hypothetical protein
MTLTAKERKRRRADNSARWERMNPERVVAKRKRHAANHAVFNRNWHLLRRYGLSVQEYTDLLERQNGCCAICKRPPTGLRRRFHVDHKHIDGYATLPPEEKMKGVRGLLCSTCSSGIGGLRDSPDLLLAAVAYLQKHQESYPSEDSPKCLMK